MALTECVPSACLLTCLPACLPACLHACLLACLLAFLPACMPAYLLACLPSCLLTCLPSYLLACLHACLTPRLFRMLQELIFTVLLNTITHGCTRFLLFGLQSEPKIVHKKVLNGNRILLNSIPLIGYRIMHLNRKALGLLGGKMASSSSTFCSSGSGW